MIEYLQEIAIDVCPGKASVLRARTSSRRDYAEGMKVTFRSGFYSQDRECQRENEWLQRFRKVGLREARVLSEQVF